MQPVKIVVRDMPSSPALEDHIKKKVQKLAQYYNRINSFHVMIEIPQKTHHKGKQFCVKLDLTVPGRELVVNRKMNEDVYVAIRDAFHAMIRKLEDYTRRRRGEVKVHESANYGYVKKLVADESFGFIQGMDGLEYYFSLTNVSYPSFDQLQIGDIVHFIGATADEGFQAHRVTKEKKTSFMEELE